MIVHKCDICKKEMGVWIEVNIDIGAKGPNVNVADLLQLRGTKEICKDCYLGLSAVERTEEQHD